MFNCCDATTLVKRWKLIFDDSVNQSLSRTLKKFQMFKANIKENIV